MTPEEVVKLLNCPPDQFGAALEAQQKAHRKRMDEEERRLKTLLFFVVAAMLVPFAMLIGAAVSSWWPQ